ncbi:hypothetical protein G7Z17_g6568 [Cylindrodendrum hubeiense]|uniref:Uncharacterized protein n=1 Tax=Cylindrodendrum hubeiense TaxID=595255 RepID=A0A9P5H9L0_9HYPO|nr:hypothetical protein G7Z17_g6568 [Cylindrodendrum hubeiense]
MLGFRALYHSLRLKVYTVTLSQILATICAFLTTIAAVLLTTKIIPELTTMQIQQESWFGSQQLSASYQDEYSTTREDIGSLLLARRMSNFTYPRHTYADLVFPTLGINYTNWNANISAQVRTPAAKLLPSCVKLSDGDFNVTIKNNTSGGFTATIYQNFTCPSGSSASLDDTLYINATVEKYGLSYVAGLAQSPGNTLDIGPTCHLVLDNDALLNTPWRVQTYVWGKFLNSTMDFDYLSVWRCNYSWAEVTTDVGLVWTNKVIQIDHQNPPTQDNSTIKPWSPPFGFPELGGSQGILPVNEVFPDTEVEDPLVSHLSTQFSVIVEPFGPIQIEDFGKPGQDDEILDELHSNLGFRMGFRLNRFAAHYGRQRKLAAEYGIEGPGT